jgi:hypothetical protein
MTASICAARTNMKMKRHPERRSVAPDFRLRSFRVNVFREARQIAYDILA